MGSCALALHGPNLQRRLAPCDGFRPPEARIAISWLNGELSHQQVIESGPVTVKLHIAETIDPTVASADHLGPHRSR